MTSSSALLFGKKIVTPLADGPTFQEDRARELAALKQLCISAINDKRIDRSILSTWVENYSNFEELHLVTMTSWMIDAEAIRLILEDFIDEETMTFFSRYAA